MNLRDTSFLKKIDDERSQLDVLCSMNPSKGSHRVEVALKTFDKVGRLCGMLLEAGEVRRQLSVKAILALCRTHQYDRSARIDSLTSSRMF